MQDLNDLQYFAQVVRHGGFSAASRATGEPKSKLSKRVAQLERDLGVHLIERSTRSIRVTEIGRDVFAQCEIIAGGLGAIEAIFARESAFELHASGGMLNWRHWPHRSFRDYNELANAVLRPLDLPMPEIDVGSIRAAPIAPRRVTAPPAGKA